MPLFTVLISMKMEQMIIAPFFSQARLFHRRGELDVRFRQFRVCKERRLAEDDLLEK
jgi:hypothetical protein